MIDLTSATQEAVFKALDAGVTLCSVFDHVKQGTEPNFVKVGAIESFNEGDKTDQRERFEVEVHSIYRGSDRSELLAIMHQVRTSVDEVPLVIDGVDFSTPSYLGASASDAARDGVTYAGITTFEVYAEPA